MPSDLPKAIGAVIIWLAAMGCTAQSGESNMQETADETDVFYEFSADRPAKLKFQPIEIKPGEVPGLPRAKAADQSDTVAQYVNHAKNSRTTSKLARATTWQIQWRTPLPTALRPQYLTHAANRTVLAGATQWCLVDERGQVIGNLLLNASSVTVDPRHGLFYAADRYGYIVGRRLADGAEAIGVYGHYGPQFARNQIIRNGSRMLIVSVQLPPDPFAGTDAELSMTELHELGDPITLDRDKVATSDKITANLIRKSTRLMSAYEGETLVMATENRLYVADAGLHITAALAGKFVPHTLSLDETRRAFLITHDDDKLSLWGVDPTGVRFLAVPLSSNFDTLVAPPIIGYDHRVYLLGENRIAAVDVPDQVVWELEIGEVAGAVVTPDDELVVSAGSRLLVITRDGKQRVLFSFENDVLTTPPVLSGDGSVLVASAKWLYCIAPGKP